VPIETITVTGQVLDHENLPLGGRRVVGQPRPSLFATIDGQSVSLVSDTWTDYQGRFSLSCVKAPGTIYTIQTRPERRLPLQLELRCDDHLGGAVVDVGDLPQALPVPVVPGQTVDQIKADILAELRPRVSAPFSDPRPILTVGAGTMRYPNARSDTVHVIAVELALGIEPTGADLVVDVHKSGTTIFTDQSHRPRVAAGSLVGLTTTIDVPAFGPEDWLTVDIDQIGSVNPGGQLVAVVVLDG
jgi:hypothetical protein